jgi:hypothetical protein
VKSHNEKGDIKFNEFTQNSVKSHNEKGYTNSMNSLKKSSQITLWRRGHKFNEFTQNPVKSYSEKNTFKKFTQSPMKSHNEKRTHAIVVHFLLKAKLVACNDLIPSKNTAQPSASWESCIQHFGYNTTPRVKLLIFSKAPCLCTRQECRVVNYEISWDRCAMWWLGKKKTWQALYTKSGWVNPFFPKHLVFCTVQDGCYIYIRNTFPLIIPIP